MGNRAEGHSSSTLTREVDKYMKHKVFVYGTLKRGYSNHGLLSNSDFLGLAKTAPAFTMISLGGFPGLLLNGGTSVQGEVYEVDNDTFKQLDRLEGYPRFYNRITIDTEYGDAWVYILDRNEYRGYREVSTGNWQGAA